MGTIKIIITSKVPVHAIRAPSRKTFNTYSSVLMLSGIFLTRLQCQSLPQFLPFPGLLGIDLVVLLKFVYKHSPVSPCDLFLMSSCKKMCTPLKGSHLYRGLVSHDIISKQLIGREPFGGNRDAGYKRREISRKMTVLTSTLKGKYLSLITGTSHPAIRILVKFIDFYLAFLGAFTVLSSISK